MIARYPLSGLSPSCLAALMTLVAAKAASAQCAAVEWQTHSGTGPGARTAARMSADGHGAIVLFGGAGPMTPALGDCWRLDLTTRTWQQHGGPLPPPRNAHAMALDPTANRVVLFGGNAATGPVPTARLNDTWTWDGQQWASLAPPTVPAARDAHDMAWSENSGRVILFGGWNGVSFFGDTWSWNGTNWHLETLPTSPGARVNARLAADRATGRVVMFGGRDTITTYLDETWEWDGSTWSQVGGPGPSARDRVALATDCRSGCLLFGGVSGQGHHADTWRYRAGVWCRATPNQAPAARAEGAIATDDHTGRVLVTSGAGSNGAFADTWEAGIPGSWSMFGQGCMVPGAAATLQLSGLGNRPLPHLLPFQLRHGGAHRLWLLFVAVAPASVSLGNCPILLSQPFELLTFGLTDQAGDSLPTLTLPPGCLLHELTFHWQAAVAIPSAHGVDAYTSNRLATTLGSL